MGLRPHNSISERLTAAQVAIKNTVADSEILALVSQYGYTSDKLLAGKGLLESAATAVNAAVATSGAQYLATSQFDSALTAARNSYQSLAKVARAVFLKEPSYAAILGLDKKMPLPLAGFLVAAHTLFDNAVGVPEISSALAAYGYDENKLKTERSVIDACDVANQAQEHAKGAAQQATIEQDAALKLLDEWMAQYKKIARVALANKKQLLEKIGITVRTSLTEAQREGKKKAAATREKKKTTQPVA